MKIHKTKGSMSLLLLIRAKIKMTSKVSLRIKEKRHLVEVKRVKLASLVESVEEVQLN